jgi:pantothenate kinase
LKDKSYHSSRGNGTSVGIDVGATLAKISIRTPGHAPEFRSIPAAALGDVAEIVERARPARVGVTGGGSGELARLLSHDVLPVNEFACWGAGSTALLREQLGQDLTMERHLVVSVGTGTSIMLVDGLSVTRVAAPRSGRHRGGLGSLLTSLQSFSRIADLASSGGAATWISWSRHLSPGRDPLAGS